MNEFYDNDKLFITGVERITRALDKFPKLITELRKKYALLSPKLKTLREDVKKLEEREDKLAEDCKKKSIRIDSLKRVEIALENNLAKAKDRHDEVIRASEKASKRECAITKHSIEKKGLELADKETKLLSDKKEIEKRLLTAKGIQETARDKEKVAEEKLGELQRKEAAFSEKKMKLETDKLEFEQKKSGKSDAIDKAVMGALAKKEIDLQQREGVVSFKEKAFSKKKTELDARERALKIGEIRLKDQIRTFEANQ